MKLFKIINKDMFQWKDTAKQKKIGCNFVPELNHFISEIKATSFKKLEITVEMLNVLSQLLEPYCKGGIRLDIHKWSFYGVPIKVTDWKNKEEKEFYEEYFMCNGRFPIFLR